jgi:hypothetical protein
MIRADIYSAFDSPHQKKIVDRLRFSALDSIYMAVLKRVLSKLIVENIVI